MGVDVNRREHATWESSQVDKLERRTGLEKERRGWIIPRKKIMRCVIHGPPAWSTCCCGKLLWWIRPDVVDVYVFLMGWDVDGRGDCFCAASVVIPVV
jgi:hypothetical protein